MTPRTDLFAAIAKGDVVLRMGNAAGTAKQRHEVSLLAQALPPGSCITVGSYRLERHDGNPGTTEFFGYDTGCLNWKGIPTAKDFDQFCTDDLPTIIKLAENYEHELVVSVHDESLHAVLHMARMALDAGAHKVEINTACPNTNTGELICFREDGGMEYLNHEINITPRLAHRVGLKVGVYSNPAQLARIASVVQDVAFVTVCNTFPNAMAFDAATGAPVIDPGPFGGLSGRFLKPIALGQVRQWRNALPEARIKGVGGIRSGADVTDFYLAGADEVQVGSTYYMGGASVFRHIYNEIGNEIGVTA